MFNKSHFLYKILWVTYLLFNITACKKNDLINTSTISGTVFNTATGKGYKGAVVTLISDYGGNSYLRDVNSDANGKFTFSNCNIHSSSTYSYSLIVCAATNYYVNGGIASDRIELDKNNLENIQMPVYPTFKSLTICLPNNTIINPTDSLKVYIEQRYLHKTIPSRKYTSFNFDFSINNKHTIDYFDMGWWYCTTTKVKEGIRTVVIDSVYIDENATLVDTIPF